MCISEYHWHYPKAMDKNHYIKKSIKQSTAEKNIKLIQIASVITLKMAEAALGTFDCTPTTHSQVSDAGQVFIPVLL